MTRTRDRIATHIQAHPGVHFNGLVDALGYAPGQVQHHLKNLLDTPDYAAHPLYGRTHYFPAGYTDWERCALALLRRETSRHVVATLLADDTATPSELADAAGVARSTLEYHLDRLTTQGVTTKDRDSRGRVTVRLARPDDTRALIRDADPTLLLRLADRFTVLVDRLLTD